MAAKTDLETKLATTTARPQPRLSCKGSGRAVGTGPHTHKGRRRAPGAGPRIPTTRLRCTMFYI
jgi:hypothetical protein